MKTRDGNKGLEAVQVDGGPIHLVLGNEKKKLTKEDARLLLRVATAILAKDGSL